MVTYISLWKKWKGRRKGLEQEAAGNQEKQELRMKMWSTAKIPEVQTAPLQLAFSWEKRRAALVILLGREQGLLCGNSESAWHGRKSWHYHSTFYEHPCALWSCPTLCDPVNHGLPGSSVHVILQSRTLEWFVMPSSRVSSQLRDRTLVSFASCIGRRALYH